MSARAPGAPRRPWRLIRTDHFTPVTLVSDQKAYVEGAFHALTKIAAVSYKLEVHNSHGEVVNRYTPAHVASPLRPIQGKSADVWIIDDPVQAYLETDDDDDDT